MKETRRSFLQVKILLALEKKPAKSIVALTGIVNAQRPSVSRSLRALKEQRLVSRDRRGWHLTETGKTELSTIKYKLEENQNDLREAVLLASRALSEVNISHIANTAKEIGNINKFISPLTVPNKKYLDKLISPVIMADRTYLDKLISPITMANREIFEHFSALAKVENPFLSNDFFYNTLKPILDIQEQNSALMQKFMSSQAFMAIETLTSINSKLMAQTLDSLSTMRLDIFEKIGGGALLNSFDWLAKDISSVTQAFTQVFHDQIQVLEIPQLPNIDVITTDKFLLPPTILASYTSSAKDFVAADLKTDLQPLAYQEISFDEMGDQELDNQLFQFNPVYVEMRRGAWQALQQQNPERLRHAATSQRELVRQLFVQLVPDSQLPKEDKGGTKLKTRIRIALGTSDSNAEFIDSVGNALVSLYDQLNKYTHHNEKHEESLRALMHTGEGLIRFILSLITYDKK